MTSVGSGVGTDAAERRTGRFVLVAAVLVALIVWVYSHSLNPSRPGASTHGWLGWADQAHYLMETESLARGELPGIYVDPETFEVHPGWDREGNPPLYFYGLGYPILGVPGVWFDIGRDPFTVADLGLWGLTIGCVALVGLRMRGPSFAAVAAGAAVLATPLIDVFVVPWNSSVAIAAVAVALVVGTDRRPTIRRAGVPLGVAVGMCFAARYVDAVAPALIGGVPLLLRGRSLRDAAWKALLVAGVITCVFASVVLWSHQRVFGDPLTTPYVLHTQADGGNDQSLDSYDLGRVPGAFVGIFVTAHSDGQRFPGDPLLLRFPWAVLAPVGLASLWVRRSRDTPALSIAAALSVLGTVFYLSFKIGTAESLQYGSLRYFAPWFPIWALLALEAVWWAADEQGPTPISW